MNCGGGGAGKGPDRFVCPSDRILALRAKLKTGWSIKTGSLGAPQPPAREPLTRHETETILEVVRRAEAEERREAERVGKLVERLESMRRMALGRNPTECLLCGETFGVLSGGGPRMICADCRKTVCTKCGVETASSHRHQRDIWLCKICAETREMWKKSGAWFFRGLPQYVLPPNSKYRTNPSSAGTGSGSGSSGGGGRSPNNPNTMRTQEDAASSGSDEERRSTMFLSTSRHVQSNRSDSSTRLSPTNIDTQSNHHESSYNRQGSSSELQRSSGTVTFHEPLEHQHSVRWEDSGSYSGTNNYTGSESGSTSVFYVRNDSMRRDSITSRSDLTYSTDDKMSLSGSSVSGGGASTFQGIPEEHINTCPLNSAMGIVELTVQYDSFSNVLHCNIHRAKNLTPMDINNLSDPFCKLNILPTNNPSTRLRTKTVHKTRNPEFNETVTFYGVTDNDIMKKSLHVLILDDDKYGYDFMGEAKIALIGLRAQNSVKISATLCGPSPAGDYAPDTNHISALWGDVPNTRGQLLIALTYNTKRRSLIVGIVRCIHLPPMDSNGYSDPFVKLHLSPDPHHKKHKTSIKWKTLNPTFNEEFAFETRPNELSTQSLRLTVWDKDYGKSNDYLGGLILGSMSKGKRLKHWLDVIKFPDHRHEAWHYLTEDMVSD